MSDLTEEKYEISSVGTQGRAERVREVVRLAGGKTAISTRTGIPKTTLDGYLKGGEMKLSNAAALARAAGVCLEWLATGAGPMRPGDSPAPPAEPPRAQDVLDLDDLATSYEAALNAFVQRGVARPDARKLLALTLALYDGARAILQSQDDENKERRNP
jgi:hypothetical protein